jgi:hypothetical protein
MRHQPSPSEGFSYRNPEWGVWWWNGSKLRNRTPDIRHSKDGVAVHSGASKGCKAGKAGCAARLHFFNKHHDFLAAYLIAWLIANFMLCNTAATNRD